MQPTQRRALVVFALALAIVTALLQLPRREEGGPGGFERAFAGLEPADLTRLEIQPPRGAPPVVLVRDEQGWSLHGEPVRRADSFRADALAQAAAGLALREGRAGLRPEDCGLGSDEAVRVVLHIGASRRETLLIGGATPVGDATWVQWNGAIRPAEGALGQTFTVAPESLVQAEALPEDPAAEGPLPEAEAPIP